MTEPGILNIEEIQIVEKKVEVPVENPEEPGVVIVHCHFDGGGAIRIWRSTFLMDRNSSHQSKLLHAENITMYPQWLLVDENVQHVFTLYFEALPQSCALFDLKEIIPQDGGFFMPSIPRNEKDVYRVKIG